MTQAGNKWEVSVIAETDCADRRDRCGTDPVDRMCGLPPALGSESGTLIRPENRRYRSKWGIGRIFLGIEIRGL